MIGRRCVVQSDNDTSRPVSLSVWQATRPSCCINKLKQPRCARYRKVTNETGTEDLLGKDKQALWSGADEVKMTDDRPWAKADQGDGGGMFV